MARTPIRRVITGHGAKTNSAKVIFDGPASNTKTPRDGVASTLMWCTDEMPADIAIGENVEDMGARILGTAPPENGSRFIVMEFAPGIVSEMHRTETIDYIVMLSGQIDMDMDEWQRHIARRRYHGPARHQSRLGQSQHGAGAPRHCADGCKTARHRPSAAARPAGALINSVTISFIVTCAGISAAASAGSLARSQKAGITVVACTARTSATVSDNNGCTFQRMVCARPLLVSRSAGVVGLT